MLNQAREGEERGRGIPRTDFERAITHYGITEEEYCAHPDWYPLPERGYGLTTGNEVSPECSSCWPFLVFGLAMGGLLGTGFAMLLQKGIK